MWSRKSLVWWAMSLERGRSRITKDLISQAKDSEGWILFSKPWGVNDGFLNQEEV